MRRIVIALVLVGCGPDGMGVAGTTGDVGSSSDESTGGATSTSGGESTGDPAVRGSESGDESSTGEIGTSTGEVCEGVSVEIDPASSETCDEVCAGSDMMCEQGAEGLPCGQPLPPGLQGPLFCTCC